jgi:ectoine hydroxylase-related dioxygenase (phytanoyl-CoA dioxygenase family)
MSKYELSLAALEARNIVADSATIGTRIEAYRTRDPSEHPKLIVDQQASAAQQAKRGLPEIDAQEFTVDQLRAAMAEHGALIVRNMFSRTSMDTLITAADRVIDACADPNVTNPVSTYFNPPNNLRTIMPRKDKELGNTRSFHRESGSAMCVEAPSVAEALLLLYEAHGLKELVGAYLGEPPCLSVKKWVLRRSKLPVAEAGWHQDGAFMGTNLNSINMWVPLNECGGETGAPGMDVVPLRLNSLASAEGAQFDWSVSDAQVSSRFAENRPLMPVFNAGDAFFFDHYYLHRTQYRTDFTKLRYAVETWFFGASSFPKNQIPLAW